MNMSSKLQPNVNTEANSAFIQELKQTDSKRFAKLAKCDPIARKVMPTGEGWTVGVCAACAGAIIGAPFVEHGTQAGDGRNYCSRACRDGKVVSIHTPLLQRKYGTTAERLDAERTKHAEAQARLRLKKLA
jgi:predicted outer membrane lipoprotein